MQSTRDEARALLARYPYRGVSLCETEADPDAMLAVIDWLADGLLDYGYTVLGACEDELSKVRTALKYDRQD